MLKNEGFFSNWREETQTQKHTDATLGNFKNTRDIWDGFRWTLNENCLLIFTGDIVDRGKEQLQCLYLVYSLFLYNPYQVVLCRGNHEYTTQHRRYEFPALSKSQTTWTTQIFNAIPVMNLV
mgnify:CR=1 FL=1